MAGDNAKLLEAWREKVRTPSVHEQLWKILLDYYFVGGMPEAVKTWVAPNTGINERCQRVTQIHKDLVTGYQRDFGKYSGKVDAQHIEAVFMAVPRQLSRNVDDSANRFVFKKVIEKKRRYKELRGPIDWLEKSKLVSKCYRVDSRPTAPLAALVKENFFKLFLFDIGLLGYLLEMNYADQTAQKIHYKGYIAENFVQNEIRASGVYPTYSWETARSEIEFLHRCIDGEIIPVEVKSGSRTQAKSLRSFVDRYAPSRTVKLIGAVGSDDDMRTDLVWPLYYCQHLKGL